MSKHEYYYTNLNWTRMKLDKLNINYEVNAKEKTITIHSDLNRVEINKIMGTI